MALNSEKARSFRQTMKAPRIALPHIDDVEPLSKDDEACLRELRDVLQRHDRLSRFGVTLLHQHFQLAHDEALIEECDVNARILTVKVAKPACLNAKIMPTHWQFSATSKIVMYCKQFCRRDREGGHEATHQVIGR